MKGLLLKDYYTLLKQAKIVLLLILLFAVIPGYSVSAMAIVYAAMLPITALAYDEQAKWDSLAAMMPYSVRQLVLSKYLLGYFGIFGATALALLAQTGLALVGRAAVEPELFVSLLLTVCVAVIIMALNLPLMFKAGVEKGRIAFFILIGAIVAAAMALGDKMDGLLTVSLSNLALVAIAATGITVIVSLSSILVSLAMYKRRAL